MPDHLHALIVPNNGTISDIMRNIKAYSGNGIRKELNLTSDVWQDGFYDHVVVDQADLTAKLHYAHRNPIRKGIVDELESYPYSSYINYYTEDEPILEIDIMS